jgi:hypothetical protein
LLSNVIDLRIVLGNDGTQLHCLYALIEILLQLLTCNPKQ